jgi:hypothetical protein
MQFIVTVRNSKGNDVTTGMINRRDDSAAHMFSRHLAQSLKAGYTLTVTDFQNDEEVVTWTAHKDGKPTFTRPMVETVVFHADGVDVGFTADKALVKS